MEILPIKYTGNLPKSSILQNSIKNEKPEIINSAIIPINCENIQKVPNFPIISDSTKLTKLELFEKVHGLFENYINAVNKKDGISEIQQKYFYWDF